MEKAGVQDLVGDEPAQLQAAEEMKKNKFKELYSDACQRIARQDKIYSII